MSTTGVVGVFLCVGNIYNICSVYVCVCLFICLLFIYWLAELAGIRNFSVTPTGLSGRPFDGTICFYYLTYIYFFEFLMFFFVTCPHTLATTPRHTFPIPISIVPECILPAGRSGTGTRSGHC